VDREKLAREAIRLIRTDARFRWPRHVRWFLTGLSVGLMLALIYYSE
jgi:hypothetical protein